MQQCQMALKLIHWVNKKKIRGGGSDMKNTGFKKLSFILTLVVKRTITGVGLVSLELKDSDWELTGSN